MASGLIMVAHKSGGPLMDIVVTSPDNERNGFLAETPSEYAKIIKQILETSPEALQKIRERARSSVDRFSDEQFAEKFLQPLEALL